MAKWSSLRDRTLPTCVVAPYATCTGSGVGMRNRGGAGRWIAPRCRWKSQGCSCRLSPVSRPFRTDRNASGLPGAPLASASPRQMVYAPPSRVHRAGAFGGCRSCPGCAVGSHGSRGVRGPLLPCSGKVSTPGAPVGTGATVEPWTACGRGEIARVPGMRPFRQVHLHLAPAWRGQGWRCSSCDMRLSHRCSEYLWSGLARGHHHLLISARADSRIPGGTPLPRRSEHHLDLHAAGKRVSVLATRIREVLQIRLNGHGL